MKEVATSATRIIIGVAAVIGIGIIAFLSYQSYAFRKNQDAQAGYRKAVTDEIVKARRRERVLKADQESQNPVAKQSLESTPVPYQHDYKEEDFLRKVEGLTMKQVIRDIGNPDALYTVPNPDRRGTPIKTLCYKNIIQDADGKPNRHAFIMTHESVTVQRDNVTVHDDWEVATLAAAATQVFAER